MILKRAVHEFMAQPMVSQFRMGRIYKSFKVMPPVIAMLGRGGAEQVT